MKDTRIKRSKFREEVLKKFRTQADFCRVVSISCSKLSNIINGTVDPDRGDVAKFSEGLSLSRKEVQELLDLDW